MPGLREALAAPAIRLFLVAAAALSAMTWAFTIVLAIAAYRHGGVAGVGVVTTVRLLAAALAAPVTALLGDLFSRRAVLLGLAGASAVLLAAMALLEASGEPFALLVILAAALTAATTGNRPTEAALLVGLCAGPRELGSASATWSALDNAGFLVGSLAGGAAAAVSAEAGFLLAAVLCALATMAVAAMPSDGRPQHRAPLRDTPIVRDLVLGARELVRTPLVRDAAGLLVGLAALDGVLDVLIVAVAYDVLGLAIASVGWLNAAWGAGGVLGGLGAAALLGRARLPLAIAAGAVGMGATLALLAAAPGPISAVALFVLFGAAYALVDSGATTSVQRLASDEALARVFGVIESAGLIGAAAGAAGAAALVDALGTRAALVAVALPLPLFVLLRRRAVLRLRPDTSAPPDRLRLLRSLDVFAPLALATIETLACAPSSAAQPPARS